MVYSSYNTEWDRQNFLSFCATFSPFTTPSPKKSKFWRKNEKNCLDILSFYTYIHVYHKWKSYDIWFLKYKVQQTEIFLTFGHVLPSCFLPPCWAFYPPMDSKIKILKKWKNHLKILSFSYCVPEMIAIWCILPKIWSATDKMFCYFEPFFALSCP